MGISRTGKTFLGVSLLFLLLGAGNILYGHQRATNYQQLLYEARQQLKDDFAKSGHRTELSRLDPSGRRTRSRGIADTLPRTLLKSKPNFERQIEHVRKLATRLSYYRFSVLGGKCFVALSGACLLLFLAFGRAKQREAQSI